MKLNQLPKIEFLVHQNLSRIDVKANWTRLLIDNVASCKILGQFFPNIVSSQDQYSVQIASSSYLLLGRQCCKDINTHLLICVPYRMGVGNKLMGWEKPNNSIPTHSPKKKKEKKCWCGNIFLRIRDIHENDHLGG